MEQYIGWGKILKSSYGRKGSKRWEHFYGGSQSLKTKCKDVNLAIGGGLGWMKLLKDEAWKGSMFHAIILALFPFR